MPEANGPLLSMTVCMYTNTPDAHFVVYRDLSRPYLTVACGFSGHGFKFSSVIGEVLADLSFTARARLPIEFLSPARFRKGAGAMNGAHGAAGEGR
jgi:sarcosine oxidase